jgi:hypothetical protein
MFIDTNSGWKTCEIGARQGANRSQVRPRTAEQGAIYGDATR